MTAAELLVASALTAGVAATTFAMTRSLQAVFEVHPEAADVEQRLRVGAHLLAHDLRAALPPIRPYRIGVRGHDPTAGIYYRPDTITVIPFAENGGSAGTRTYYLRQDPASGTARLMVYDGGVTDMPAVDHLVLLRFDYFDGTGSAIGAAALQDGPWFPDEADPERFDVDLLRIRRIGVTLRAQAATPLLRTRVPTRELRLEVAARNLRP